MGEKAPVRWAILDKMGAISIALFVFFGLAYYAFPTERLYDQISMSVTKDQSGKFWFNSQRKINFFEDVLVNYTASIQVVGRDDAAICTYEGQFNARQVNDDLVRYEALPWSVPCLEQGPPTSLTFIRTALLFDFIPLRPQRYTFVINPETAPVVNQE